MVKKVKKIAPVLKLLKVLKKPGKLTLIAILAGKPVAKKKKIALGLKILEAIVQDLSQALKALKEKKEDAKQNKKKEAGKKGAKKSCVAAQALGVEDDSEYIIINYGIVLRRMRAP